MALSLGGQTVASSLSQAGFEVSTPGVSLIETADPRARHRTVLVQSAWNVIGWQEFRALQRRYPPRMQARALARRRLTGINLRRAEQIVCLTEAMAVWTRAFTGRDVAVAPVTVPLDAPPRAVAAAERRDAVVVPGNLSWYKRPHLALEWAHERNIGTVEFLGLDDGSGCRAQLEARARELGLQVSFRVAERQHLYAELAAARTVLLPSALESLGFTLAEALWMGADVVASPIPAHREVAARLGLEPVWLDGAKPAIQPGARAAGQDKVRTEWEALGDVLGLRRTPSAS
jgi:glycosyltransferase involved in cell wall biosynthesis